MTTTPNWGFPLPPDSTLIATFPQMVRHQSNQLEQRLPAAVAGEVRARLAPVTEDMNLARTLSTRTAARQDTLEGRQAALQTQQDGLEARQEGLELIAGTDPAGMTDGAVTNLIANENTGTRSALTAATLRTVERARARRVTAAAFLRAQLLEAATRPVTLAFTGSSTTASTTATTVEATYPALVQRALQRAFTPLPWPAPVRVTSAAPARPSAPGVHAFNMGVSGATSVTYLTPAVRAALASVQPAAVIHAIGANDWHLGNSPEAYRLHMAAALSAIDADVTRPPLHVLVHQHSRASVSAWEWSDYLTVLHDLAAEDPQRRMVIDADAAFQAVGIPGADPLGLLHTDRVHLSNAGYLLLAELVSQATAEATAAAMTAPVNLAGWIPAGAMALTSDTFTRGEGSALSGGSTNAALGGSPMTWKATIAGDVLRGGQASLAAGGYLYLDDARMGSSVYLGITLPALPAGAGLDIRASRVGTSGGVNSLTVAPDGTFGKGTSGAVTHRFGTASPGDQLGVAVQGPIMTYYHNGRAVGAATAGLTGGTTTGLTTYAARTDVRVDNVIVASMP